MNAQDILTAAAKHIEERGKAHDSPASQGGERNMGRIVKAFNAITGLSLTTTQGWLFMAVLKMVRSQTASSFNPDHMEDGAAYLGLAGEEASLSAPVPFEISDGCAGTNGPSGPLEEPQSTEGSEWRMLEIGEQRQLCDEIQIRKGDWVKYEPDLYYPTQELDGLKSRRKVK